MTTPVPSVPNFLPGVGYQQSDMYAQWTNPAAFFQKRMVLRVRQHTTTTSLPDSGALTIIQYDTVDEDPYSGWNATSFWWEPPAGYSGLFQVTVCPYVHTSISNMVLAPGVILNNTETITDLNGTYVPTSINCGSEGTTLVWLSGGQDTVSGAAANLNNTSGAVSTTSGALGQESSMEIVWICA